MSHGDIIKNQIKHQRVPNLNLELKGQYRVTGSSISPRSVSNTKGDKTKTNSTVGGSSCVNLAVDPISIIFEEESKSNFSDRSDPGDNNSMMPPQSKINNQDLDVSNVEF